MKIWMNVTDAAEYAGVCKDTIYTSHPLATPSAPRRVQRFEDLRSIGDTLFVECLDVLDARRGIEVLVVPTILPLRRILGRFLQIQFQSIQTPDRVEPAPRLAETETQPLVVRDRALKVVDEELRSERCNTRLGLVRRCSLPERIPQRHHEHSTR